MKQELGAGGCGPTVVCFTYPPVKTVSGASLGGREHSWKPVLSSKRGERRLWRQWEPRSCRALDTIWRFGDFTPNKRESHWRPLNREGTWSKMAKEQGNWQRWKSLKRLEGIRSRAGGMGSLNGLAPGLLNLCRECGMCPPAVSALWVWKCFSSALGSARQSLQELETLGQSPQAGKQPFSSCCIEQILSFSVFVKMHERLEIS